MRPCLSRPPVRPALSLRGLRHLLPAIVADLSLMTRGRAHEYVRTGYDAPVPAAAGTRAEASERVQEAIVAATVRIVAHGGVAAVTHRRVAAEAGVSLSSTTWHFATKDDILVAALRWTARREIERISEIAARLAGARFDPQAWAGALGAWIVEQVSAERDLTVALYRLQIELLGRPEAQEVHREWGDGLRSLGARVLDGSSPSPALDTRLVAATLDGLRLAVISANERDEEWLAPAVERLLRALLG
jgi:TetR/AcrR family transcriptional regulator, regulator of biofilm formation and stress response